MGESGNTANNAVLNEQHSSNGTAPRVFKRRLEIPLFALAGVDLCLWKGNRLSRRIEKQGQGKPHDSPALLLYLILCFLIAKALHKVQEPGKPGLILLVDTRVGQHLGAYLCHFAAEQRISLLRGLA